MDIDVERFVQSLHDCGPGTREEKGVVFAAEITSDIKEYCSQQTIESSSNISKYILYFTACIDVSTGCSFILFLYRFRPVCVAQSGTRFKLFSCKMWQECCLPGIN